MIRDGEIVVVQFGSWPNAGTSGGSGEPCVKVHMVRGWYMKMMKMYMEMKKVAERLGTLTTCLYQVPP